MCFQRRFELTKSHRVFLYDMVCHSKVWEQRDKRSVVHNYDIVETDGETRLSFDEERRFRDGLYS